MLYNGIDFRKKPSGDVDVQSDPAIATPSQAASAPQQSNTPAPVAPYAQGTCSFNATEAVGTTPTIQWQVERCPDQKCEGANVTAVSTNE